MGRVYNFNGEERGAFRVVVGKPEGRIPPGIHRLKWINNIKIDCKDVVCDGVAWIHLA